MKKWIEPERGHLKEARIRIGAGGITEKVALREWNALNDKQRRVFFCFFSFAEKEKKENILRSVNGGEIDDGKKFELFNFHPK